MPKASIASFDSPLAKRLRDLMDERGISQNELAEAIGATRQAVSQYRNGTVAPNIEKLCQISLFFKVTTDYLLGLESAPSHTATDICHETGLAPQAVEVLNMNAKIARSNLGWDKFFKDFGDDGEPLLQTTTELEAKTLNHIIANCNAIIGAIGLYWFGEFTGVENVKVDGYSVNLIGPGEFVRNGLLQSIILKLQSYRTHLIENSGDLPLTWVLDATKTARKDAFIKQRVEWLEQQRGRALTDEEIQQQNDWWEQGQQTADPGDSDPEPATKT